MAERLSLLREHPDYGHCAAGRALPRPWLLTARAEGCSPWPLEYLRETLPRNKKTFLYGRGRQAPRDGHGQQPWAAASRSSGPGGRVVPPKNPSLARAAIGTEAGHGHRAGEGRAVCASEPLPAPSPTHSRLPNWRPGEALKQPEAGVGQGEDQACWRREGPEQVLPCPHLTTLMD